MPPEALGQVLPIWHSGIVAQLANAPADIRIERWLWNSWPGLRDAQEASLRDQARALQLVLHPSVEVLTPPTIFRASNAMNFAFVRSIGDLLGAPELVKPYDRTPAARAGSELLGLLNSEDDSGFMGDRIMTDRWARHLGLSLWFDWRRLSELPKRYQHAWH